MSTTGRAARHGWDAPSESDQLGHRDVLPAPGKRTLTERLMRRRADGGELGPDAEHLVDDAGRGGGESLPGHLRGRLERSLGADLSGVRVHTGDTSNRAAASVGALAYTTGQDIHFGAGTYDPESASGQELIAHEVAHTVQQRGAAPTPQPKLEVSQPGDAHEAEADAFASAFVAGGTSAVTAGAVDGGIDRKTPPGPGGEVKTEQSLEIDLGGGKKVKFTSSSLSAEVELDKKEFPDPPFEKSKTFPTYFAPGVFGYISVGCAAGVSDTMKVSLTASKSGEGDATTWSVSVGGTSEVKGELKASLSLGVGAGCPGILGLRAEAAALPSVSLTANTGITGALNWSKAAGVTGTISMPFEVKGELAAELALRLLYDVFWKPNPSEFAKYTLAKWVIATAQMNMTPKITIPGGFSATYTEPSIQWGDSPEPQHAGGREAGSFVSDYQNGGPGGDGGGSGSGPGVAPTEDEGEVLLDDGAGETEIPAAPAPGASEFEHGECVDPSLGGPNQSTSEPDQSTSEPDQSTADDGGMCY